MENKTKNIVIGITCIVAIIVLVTSLTFGIVQGLDWQEITKNEDETIESDTTTTGCVNFDFNEQTTNNGMILSYGEAKSASGNDTSYTLVATVVPDDSNNKLVDWSLSWLYSTGDFEKQNNVYDFIEMIVENDGSNEAEINIIEAFPNHPIVIKATTRQGGFYATCLARYIGFAESMIVDLTPLYDGDILANATTTFDIDFDKYFGVVTDEYITDFAMFEVTVEAVGSFTAKHVYTTSVTNIVNDVEVSLSAIADHSTITANVVDGKLVLTATNPITSYLLDRSVGGFTPTLNPNLKVAPDLNGTGLGSIVDITSYKSGAENCYWNITITDTVGGYSTTIQVGIYSDITGVSMSDTEILF